MFYLRNTRPGTQSTTFNETSKAITERQLDDNCRITENLNFCHEKSELLISKTVNNLGDQERTTKTTFFLTYPKLGH